MFSSSSGSTLFALMIISLSAYQSMERTIKRNVTPLFVNQQHLFDNRLRKSSPLNVFYGHRANSPIGRYSIFVWRTSLYFVNWRENQLCVAPTGDTCSSTDFVHPQNYNCLILVAPWLCNSRSFVFQSQIRLISSGRTKWTCARSHSHRSFI